MARRHAASWWIYEQSDTLEEAGLYHLLFQQSVEFDLAVLPPRFAQACAREMLCEVKERIKEDYMKKLRADLHEFLAAGGQMPEQQQGGKGKQSEYVSGSPWEQQKGGKGRFTTVLL